MSHRPVEPSPCERHLYTATGRWSRNFLTLEPHRCSLPSRNPAGLQRRTLLWWMSAFLVIAMVVALSILLEFAL